MAKDRVPDTYPRFALVAIPFEGTIKLTQLVSLERELDKGMGRFVIAREDTEMFLPDGLDPAQSNPCRHEDDGA